MASVIPMKWENGRSTHMCTKGVNVHRVSLGLHETQYPGSSSVQYEVFLVYSPSVPRALVTFGTATIILAFADPSETVA